MATTRDTKLGAWQSTLSRRIFLQGAGALAAAASVAELLIDREPAPHSERFGFTSVHTRVRPDRAEGAGWGSTCASSISSPGS